MDAGFDVWIPLQFVGAREVLESVMGFGGVPIGSIPGVGEFFGGIHETVSDHIRSRLEDQVVEALRSHVVDAIENQLQTYAQEALHELKDYAIDHSIFQ